MVKSNTMTTSGMTIIESDEDLEIVSTIDAEYNSKSNLVIEYYCINYEKRRKVIDYTATVDKENTEKLAKRLKVNLSICRRPSMMNSVTARVCHVYRILNTSSRKSWTSYLIVA